MAKTYTHSEAHATAYEVALRKGQNLDASVLAEHIRRDERFELNLRNDGRITHACFIAGRVAAFRDLLAAAKKAAR